jgi:hypothetical protein
MGRMLISSLTLVALVACSSDDRSTGPSPADGADPTTGLSLARGGSSSVERPLSGHCTTVVSRIAPPPIEIQSFEYTCQISHLGRTHAVVTQTVDVATGALSNTGVYVAANGDQLRSSFTGSAVLSFTDPTDARVTFQGTQAFSAGTGRFADADGTADLAGTTRINLITGAGAGELTLQGTLTY